MQVFAQEPLVSMPLSCSNIILSNTTPQQLVEVYDGIKTAARQQPYMKAHFFLCHGSPSQSKNSIHQQQRPSPWLYVDEFSPIPWPIDSAICPPHMLNHSSMTSRISCSEEICGLTMAHAFVPA